MSDRLAAAVDAVDDADETRCLLLIAVSAIDAVGLGDDPLVTEALRQWRDNGVVGPSARRAVDELAGRYDEASISATAAVGSPVREKTFARARALACLALGLGAVGPEQSIGSGQSRSTVLADAAYEAAHAMGGPDGVIGVLGRVR